MDVQPHVFFLLPFASKVSSAQLETTSLHGEGIVRDEHALLFLLLLLLFLLLLLLLALI